MPGMSAAYIVQPSADAKATAISVAWILADKVTFATKGTPEEIAKQYADFVGEIAGRILTGASTEFAPLQPPKT